MTKSAPTLRERALAEAVGRALAPLIRRIGELESKSLRYEGTWKAGTSYGVNALVTDRGGMWVSLHPTSDRPPSDSWRLAAKGHQR